MANRRTSVASPSAPAVATPSSSSSSPRTSSTGGSSNSTGSRSVSSAAALGGIWNVSSCATIVLGLYMAMAMYNLHHLMFPLRMIDLTKYPNPRETFVHPLWKTSSTGSDDDGTGGGSASTMHLRVFLSTEARFSLEFLQAQDFDAPSSSSSSSSTSTTTTNNNNGDLWTTPQFSSASPTLPHVLLWDQELNHPTLSASFLLTQRNVIEEQQGSGKDDDDDDDDSSYAYALDWLNRTEQALRDSGDGGILSTLSSGSGHGIESTSILLTLYEALARRVASFLDWCSMTGRTTKSADEEEEESGFVGRTTIHIPTTSPLWARLHTNATVFVHVLVMRRTLADDRDAWPPPSLSVAEQTLRRASQSNSLLMGQVNMIKYELPNHIGQPRRLLYRDLAYYWHTYLGGTLWATPERYADGASPPWEMARSKPVEYAAYQHVTELKLNGMGYPYWKPEVSIKYVSDEDSYPEEFAYLSGMPLVSVSNNDPRNRHPDHPTGLAFIPALHVDEMGMTSEKYIPVNSTVTSLPLRISFDRSVDATHPDSAATSTKTTKRRLSSTATTGGISPARWRLLSHLSSAIEAQKSLGFEDSDIDDLKRLIADTNIMLLSITMLASALHLLFEFLTFKSEVSFWNKNKDLTGLSVRSLFLDLIGQTIILFYLIEKESSLLTTIPSAIGCIIALWKVHRAAGLKFIKAPPATNNDSPVAWWNLLPKALTGYELRATRLEARSKEYGNDLSNHTSDGMPSRSRLIAMTIEADRLATRYLGAVLLPLASGYTLYSLIFNEHRGWYSWLITSAASAVYALGFVLMTPQLFLNWKLKSVAHLPWRVLVYKSLNTFIDDLFSFIIRMPTMARISCFRDDVVFFIYLYQRWLYPVDTSRPVEGGGEGEPLLDDNAPVANGTKKIQ